MKLLYWLPRALSVLFVGFISMFALDVFSEPQWLLGLLIHLIPSLILVLLTVIAWKREKLGGILFVVTGLVVLVATQIEAWVVTMPMIVIGGLYIISGTKKKSK